MMINLKAIVQRSKRAKMSKLSKNKINKTDLEVGIGLNDVDNLKPSRYFYKVIDSSKTYEEAEEELKKYYSSDKSINQRDKEFDLVSIRIAELIKDNSFILSPQTLKNIHKKIFTGLFEGKLKLGIGAFRKYNITKKEDILSGRSIVYSNYDEIDNYLNYDFEQEQNKDYSSMDINTQVQSVANFISNIWEVHPFCEGNTRTCAIFCIKYLNKLGYDINNDLFKQYSKYFRNALVLANYSDMKNGIGYDKSCLESFFANLMVDKKIELKELQNPYKFLEQKKNKND